MVWPSSDPPYGVIESERFTEKAARLAGSIKRWDEIKEALDLHLARNPTLFPEIAGTGLRAVQLATIPSRTVYFTVDEDAKTLTFQDIQ